MIPMNYLPKKQNSIPIGKITEQPIFDRSLEIDTLACIIFDPDNYSKVLLLGEDDFYSLDTKALFVAIKNNYTIEKIINLSSIEVTLKATDCFLQIRNSNDYIVPDQVDFNIKKLKEISDKRKLQDIFYNANIKILEGEDSKDVNNWFNAETDKIKRSSGAIETTANEADDEMMEILEGSKAKPISTGFALFDESTGGLDYGCMIVIAAIQGAGKTTLTLNMLDHICREEKKTVLYVSLEMNFGSLHTKLTAMMTGIPYFKLRYRKEELTDDDWTNITNARATLHGLNLIRIGKGGVSVDDIRSKLKEKKADIVIIDYLQKLDYDQKTNNDYEKLTRISQELKGLANDFNLPVVLVASLNREYANRPDHTPRISDIRGSGSIEYDADLVVLLHRNSALGKPFDLAKDKDEFIFRHQAQLIIAKNRYGESNKVINLYFDGTRSLIKEWDSYQPE